MRIGRTLPPAAAPLSVIDLLNGLTGIIYPQKSLNLLQLSISNKFKKKHCFFISSGKAAITISLKALIEISPDRNEVIIPAFNCYSVPSAIVRAGLIARPCDINPETLQFREESLLKIIDNSSKILAIFPTHIFGLPADIDRIRELTKNRGIAIIEDAAQAMGSAHHGNLLGTRGDIGIFSFARGKAISAGEGGIILTDSDIVAANISLQMENFSEYNFKQILNLAIQSIALSILIHPNLFWIPKMLPFLKLGETIFDPDFPIRKFSGFQAGIARNWETKLSFFLKERNKRVEQYRKLLSGIDNCTILSNHWKSDTLSCIRFPLLLQREEDIARILLVSEKRGLGISKTYPNSIDTIKYIDSHCDSPCANAQNVARKLLTLPCHSFVNKKDIMKIVELIQSTIAN